MQSSGAPVQSPTLIIWSLPLGMKTLYYVSLPSVFRSYDYLTIIPRARMGSESIAHEAEGLTDGLLTQRP